MYRGGDHRMRSQPSYGDNSDDRYGPQLGPDRNQDSQMERFDSFSTESDRYGHIGRGFPAGPGYTMHARSSNRSGSLNDAGDNDRTSHNVRSSSLNVPASGDYTHRPPSSQLRPVQHDDLVAKLNAMSLEQEHLQEQNNALLLRTRELEGMVAQRDPQPHSERGMGAFSRGTSLQRKKQAKRSRTLAARAQITLPESPDVSEPEVEPSDSETKPSVYLGVPTKDLPTAELKRASIVLQSEVSRAFREIVSVSGTVWPDLTVERVNEITQESYLNPVFEGMVTHPANNHLFTQVARHVSHQLQGGPTYWPDGLSVQNFDVEWDTKVLFEMAKTSFRSCKPQWRAQVDEAAARRNEENLRVNRRRERRHGVTKTEQRTKAIPAFAAQHNLRPESVKELLHEQHMSDEVSGPEDHDDAGYGDISDAALASMEFREVLDMPWRSEELSAPLHEMSVIAFNLLSPTEKKKLKSTRVRNTGRASPRIPEVAPYNFGINQTWLAANKKDSINRNLLVDWNTYADPEGFGANKQVAEVNIAEPIIVEPELREGGEN
ncbi:hypothetical protein B0H11DRAFT_1928731 [Mycena galericulata]|nr:hypothetical protein B0H11DRAFT_1928731 [Mycena galericulata]